MKSKKPLGHSALLHDAMALFAKRFDSSTCHVIKTESTTLRMNFSPTAIAVGEGCFVAHQVKNSQSVIHNGAKWKLPIVDFSSVFISAPAHQYFSASGINEFIFFLACLSMRVEYLTHCGRWLSGTEGLKALIRFSQHTGDVPISIFTGVFTIAGQDKPTVSNVLCADASEQLPRLSHQQAVN